VPRHHETLRRLQYEVRGQASWTSSAGHGSTAPPGTYRRWRLAGVPASWLTAHGFTPEPLRARPDRPLDGAAPEPG
jgi:hypothetical protein